jgi:hypothetical protein
MRPDTRVDDFVARRRQIGRERDLATAADASPERPQPVGRRRAVPGKAAALALGRRLPALVQRAFKVPSLCSRASEVFCAAGRLLASLLPGACA